MTIGRLLRTAAGFAVLVNAVPHGVSAVQGRRFPTPFANPPGRALSSPVANAIWSAVNVGGARVLLRGRERSSADDVAAAAGAMGMCLFLASYFGSLSVLREDGSAGR